MESETEAAAPYGALRILKPHHEAGCVNEVPVERELFFAALLEIERACLAHMEVATESDLTEALETDWLGPEPSWSEARDIELAKMRGELDRGALQSFALAVLGDAEVVVVSSQPPPPPG